VTSVLLGGTSKAGRQIFQQSVKSGAQSVGKKEAKDIMITAAKGRLRNVLSGVSRTGVEEGFEEAIQEVMGYVADEMFDGKSMNDLDFSRMREIAIDALILGAAAGGPLGGVSGQFKYAKAKTLVDDSYAELSEELEHQSTKDHPEKKSLYEELRRKMLTEQTLPENISDEDAQELEKLYFGVKRLDGVINATQSLKLREELTKQKEEKKNAIREIIQRNEGNAVPGTEQSTGTEQGGDGSTAAAEGDGLGTATEPGVQATDGATGNGADGSQDVVANERKIKITQLEAERDVELSKASKPDLRLTLISSKDLVNSKDEVGGKIKHDELKQRYKNVRNLIDCI
jgi:hypothetical protein